MCLCNAGFFGKDDSTNCYTCHQTRTSLAGSTDESDCVCKENRIPSSSTFNSYCDCPENYYGD